MAEPRVAAVLTSVVQKPVVCGNVFVEARGEILSRKKHLCHPIKMNPFDDIAAFFRASKKHFDGEFMYSL